MASTCPKCHQSLEDDTVCCADVKYTWKCRACGKLSTGFAVPYGRCYLCGGQNEVVKGYTGDDPRQVAVVQEAVQYKLDMYHFYRMAAQKTSDAELKDVLADMASTESEHLTDLEAKYHVHLDPEMRTPPAGAEHHMASWIFEGIDFADASGHMARVYDKAIAMETRTRDHFRARAEQLPAGPEHEAYRELAAEEEDHIALLETERRAYEG
jgi:glutamate synthase (NADPH/NADH) small chain